MSPLGGRLVRARVGHWWGAGGDRSAYRDDGLRRGLCAVAVGGGDGDRVDASDSRSGEMMLPVPSSPSK